MLLSVFSKRVDKLLYHVTQLHPTSCALSHPDTVNWPLNHLVKVKIFHVSFNFLQYWREIQ